MKYTEIEWPKLSIMGESRSPFIRGTGERPLRLTLHTASFNGLDEHNLVALKTLNELLAIPGLEVIQDIPGEFPAYQIFRDKRDPMYVPVILKDQKGTHHFGADLSPNEPTPNDLELLVRTHISAGLDIFLTASKEILEAEFNLEVHHPDERPPREFETQGTSWDGG